MIILAQSLLECLRAAALSRQTVMRTNSSGLVPAGWPGVEGNHPVAVLDIGQGQQFETFLKLGLFPGLDLGAKDTDEHISTSRFFYF
jgi:hypothetical protein